MMDGGPVRFGILGCAYIAKKLSRAISMTPGVCLHAIGSRSLEKALNFAKENNLSPDVKIYGSYESVLNDEAVDAVYIPLPTALHIEWVMKAVDRKKHVLLEKPPALTVEDLDTMISACEKQGVQLMDCTMWMHNPRTAQMQKFLKDEEAFGELTEIHTHFLVPMKEYMPGFFTDNIRIKPELDALGALGDLGWYCARAILWATDYELPATVTALPGAQFNKDGVILSCGARLVWKDAKTATFHCSFMANMAMQLLVYGTRGTLAVDDFVIPYKEDVCQFNFHRLGTFGPLDTSWSRPIETHLVDTKQPQEVLMLQKFSSLIKGVKDGSGAHDPFWPTITRKTQQVLNAVKLSIEKGCTTVALTP